MEQVMRGVSEAHGPDQAETLRGNVRLLRLIIVCTAALALVFVLILAVLQQVDLLPPGSVLPASSGMLSVLAVCGIAIVLLQRGDALTGGRVFFYGLVLACTLAAYAIDGAGSPVVISYLVPIVAAGLMGKGVDSVRVAAFAGVCYLALILAQELGGLRPLVELSRSSQSYLSLLMLSVSGCFLAFLTWTNSRDLSNILAQSSERAEELLHKTEQLMEKGIQQVELGSELSASAAEMKVTAQQQASGATEQASAVSEVSTTIEELGSTARQIAQAAEHVALAAQQTLENLSSGQDAVDESIQAMERIRGRMQDVSTRVLGLGERSQQIGEIIDLIDDISDETHLLALNAAIEAAGAGEHGRRFAVVAAEVKSLANRTLAAAKEVKGVIAEIRQATSAAVLASEEGTKEVERGVELAHRAGQVMDNIVMVAERTAQSAAEIGLATAQQQSASEQVVETMREVAEVARQSAAGARQMADSAAMLTSIADRLHGIVQT